MRYLLLLGEKYKGFQLTILKLPLQDPEEAASVLYRIKDVPPYLRRLAPVYGTSVLSNNCKKMLQIKRIKQICVYFLFQVSGWLHQPSL